MKRSVNTFLSVYIGPTAQIIVHSLGKSNKLGCYTNSCVNVTDCVPRLK